MSQSGASFRHLKQKKKTPQSSDRIMGSFVGEDFSTFSEELLAERRKKSQLAIQDESVQKFTFTW